MTQRLLYKHYFFLQILFNFFQCMLVFLDAHARCPLNNTYANSMEVTLSDMAIGNAMAAFAVKSIGGIIF